MIANDTPKLTPERRLQRTVSRKQHQIDQLKRNARDWKRLCAERDTARQALAVAITMLATKGLPLPDELVMPVHDLVAPLGEKNLQRALELFGAGLGIKKGG